jgi:hypothetical protein
MDKFCTNCHSPFTITPEDRKFYEKITVPIPTFCPSCRMQRRMSFRNERSLYKRSCNLCKKDIIAAYKPEATHPVYCPECWWGNQWNVLDYGRKLDLNEPFFPQFHALQKTVPRLSLAIVTSRAQNCDFCNYIDYAKNCYLCAGSVQVEDCLYGNPYESRDCVDSFLVRESELCYECIDSEKMYNSNFCQSCAGCNDCWFCYECTGCSDCIACTGLTRKKHHIANKPYSPEEYKKIRASLELNTPEGLQKAAAFLAQEKLKFPHRSARILNSENCTGNFIVNSKNSHHCFDVKKCWDSSYCAQVIDGKDSYDVNYCEYFELCYEHLGFDNNYDVKFSLISGNSKHCEYTDFCMNSQHLFGCISMQKQHHCILNKQYSPKEYKTLITQLKAKMRERGEYGQYFPTEISPFNYKETVANDYFPC